MRQIVLDTETTGLDTKSGHRVIEIGATEIVNRRLTGRVFHRYLNPDRAIDEGAIAVHGIRNEQLVNEPRFPDVANELMEFLAGAELVIHNASFDIGFLDNELRLMKHAQPELRKHCDVLDTLTLARERHPGQRNTLDALCKRYYIDNSKRDLHGALLDANLLAEVYLAMTGGQSSLGLEAEDASVVEERQTARLVSAEVSAKLKVFQVSADDITMHDKMMQKIQSRCDGEPVWLRSQN